MEWPTAIVTKVIMIAQQGKWRMSGSILCVGFATVFCQTEEFNDVNNNKTYSIFNIVVQAHGGVRFNAKSASIPS